MIIDRKLYRTVFMLIIAACLAACASANVKVSPLNEFPTPLVDPLPLSIGVYYSEEFRNFVYHEIQDSQGANETIIDLGEAQVSLFDRLLPSVFASVKVLDEAERTHVPAGLDAVLLPAVADIEYSAPLQSKAKIYEVWIKYQFELMAPDGSSIAKWTMPTYGKTPTAFLKSSEQALNLASLMALRDCGAAFVTGFPRVPEVAQWMDHSGTGGSVGFTAPSEENPHE